MLGLLALALDRPNYVHIWSLGSIGSVCRAVGVEK